MQSLNPAAVERMQHALDKMSKSGILVSVSKCEGDDFLYVVLVERYTDIQSEKVDWVTWWWNDQSEGFSSGHYFQNECQAMIDFCERSKRGWNYDRKMVLWAEKT